MLGATGPEGGAGGVPDVLIVGDSVDELVALESMLRTLPLRIVKRASGREALHCLLTHEFAVILLDVRVPEMDGFETASLIRRRPRSAHTPIIFVTAVGDETHVARGYSLQAVDYLTAPVVPDVLRSKVSMLVHLFAAMAEMRRQAESLRRRAGRLQRLTEAARAIEAAPSVDRILHVAAEGAREMLGARRAVALATLDERQAHRAVALAPGGRRDDEVDGAVAGIVCRTNRLHRTRPTAAPEEALAVPLTGRNGRNVGTIHVVVGLDGEFMQDDEDLLVQLARLTSIAVENSLCSEAREVSRLKDEFLATVSHELRTPLSAIVSWTWMLRRGGLDGPTAAHALDAIERNARAQGRLVDDLLDVSRIVSGTLKLDRRPVDVAAVARRAVDALVAGARAKGIELVTALAPGTGVVLGDADRLEQAIWNLVVNAIKFTPAGGRVEVGVAAAGDEVQIRVSDDGAGIPRPFLPHVFERFHQADGSATRTAGGLGLGLAIVHHIVELHGGMVAADSGGEGRGATFVVRIPALPSAIVLPVDGAGALPAASPADRVGLRGRRVLVVEDNPDTREAIGMTMADAGAEVKAVGTAHEGFSAVSEWRPDVLLCDIGLPLEDGYALIRRIRRLPNGAGALPAVALTAYARAEDRREALDAGFQAHLAKPVEAEVLLGTLEAILSRVDRCAAAPLGSPAAAPATLVGRLVGSDA